jgi:hypothetical protein
VNKGVIERGKDVGHSPDQLSFPVDSTIGYYTLLNNINHIFAIDPIQVQVQFTDYSTVRVPPRTRLTAVVSMTYLVAGPIFTFSSGAFLTFGAISIIYLIDTDW